MQYTGKAAEILDTTKFTGNGNTILPNNEHINFGGFRMHALYI